MIEPCTQEPKFGEPILIPAHDINSLELIDVYACTIDAKSCSALMGQLSATAPLAAISHAKRVRKRTDIQGKLDILLTPVHREDAMEEDVENAAVLTGNTTAQSDQASGFHCPTTAEGPSQGLSALPPVVSALVEQFSKEVFIVQVPRYAPHTKEDSQVWSEYWPVTVRAPHKTILRDKIVLSPEDVADMKQYMRKTWDLAQKNAISGGKKVANACLIVDPNGREKGNNGSAGSFIVGTGIDGSDIHPLHHAVIVAVESVAEWQRKATGAIADQRPFLDDEGMAGVSPVEEILGDNNEEKDKFAQVKTSNQSESEESGVECIKRRRLEESTTETATEMDRDRVGDASVEDSIINLECGTNSDSHIQSNMPYLCTEYDCYVVQEPCAMCAMALVHSRLRRVIFCEIDKDGGLLGGSGLKLHSKRTLNHHYNVYRIPIEM